MIFQRMHWSTSLALFLTLVASDSRGAESASQVIAADKFATATFEGRQATRGAWTFAEGIAKCSHDDALYKQFKDHGPMLSYPGSYRDGVAEVTFRSIQGERIIFTMDGEAGHVVRLKMVPGSPTTLLTWNEGVKQAIVLAADLPALADGEWTSLRVETNDETVTVRLGDQERRFEHPGVARQKTNAKISFAYGDFQAKAFHLISRD